MRMTDVDTLENVMLKILSFVIEYESYFGPVKLQIISQKFNRSLRRFGVMTVRDALKSDPRFFMFLSRSGQYLVSTPKGADSEDVIIEILKGTHDHKILMSELKNTYVRLGKSAERFSDAINSLKSNEVIRVDNDGGNVSVALVIIPDAPSGLSEVKTVKSLDVVE